MSNLLRHVQRPVELPQYSLKVPYFCVDMIFSDNIHTYMLQFCNIYFIFYIYIVLPLRQDVAYFGVDMTKDPPEPKLTYYHCVEGECIKVKTFQIRPYF